MDKVFLDANVLFSAAYRPASRLSVLWKMANVALISSAYAAEEARRNLTQEDQRVRLSGLLRKIIVLPVVLANDPLPEIAALPEKDQPILQAAIHGRATHLLTGDFKDFGQYFGQTIRGVLILPPAEYLRKKQH